MYCSECCYKLSNGEEISPRCGAPIKGYGEENNLTEHNKDQLVEQFEKEIIAFEEHLFGIELYYEVIPKLLRLPQKAAYNRIMKRGKNSLQNAKSLLEDVRTNRKSENELKAFQWPARWEAAERRIETVLRAYNLTFPNSPKEKLSKSEIKRLRKTVERML